MVLLYVLFAKFVPIISIWEFKPRQGKVPLEEKAHAAVAAGDTGQAGV
jgi:hypothetical protein